TSDFDFGHDNQVYVSPCGMGASGVTSRTPTLAFAVWRIRGQVLRSDERMAQIRLTWQRLRAEGHAVNEPATTVDVTVTSTDPTTLDETTVPEVGDCKAANVRLQARYEPHLPAFVRAAIAGGGGGGGGVSRAGGVVNVGAGVGGGRVPAAGGAANAGTVAGTSGGGGGRIQLGRSADGVTSVASVGGVPVAVFRTYQRAELWLVHTAAGRPDEVLMATTMATPSVGEFSFAPMTIQTPTGVITVSVTGTVELGRDMTGTPKLVFGASRRATFVPSSRQPRDGNSSVESGGVASTIVAVPGPEEVLSFEMPPLQAPGLPTVPDMFAIRLRLSPAK
ncbi:MAG: hypothetical protein ABI634_19900, partial [Acidobacteriota bacterium]